MGRQSWNSSTEELITFDHGLESRYWYWYRPIVFIIINISPIHGVPITNPCETYMASFLKSMLRHLCCQPKLIGFLGEISGLINYTHCMCFDNQYYFSDMPRELILLVLIVHFFYSVNSWNLLILSALVA